MNKGILTKAHDSVIGWIKKYWEKEKGYPYERGEGMIRRPDVIIVKDPAKPPSQDNIKNVVEIKFGDDEFGARQKDAYEEIAGDPKKVKVLDPDKCKCSDSDNNDGNKSQVIDWLTWAAGVAAALYSLRKGKLPKYPSPNPTPTPAW